MLIDWFTVGAQLLNFLILVWLMKRFLYKPILDAIDAREKRITAQLAEAGAQGAEAQRVRDEFQRKNEEFDQLKAGLLSQATSEATAERHRLLDDARKAADALSARRRDAMRRDAQQLSQAIARRTQQEVFAIARKALADLATTSLEARMGELFNRRLREIDDQTKNELSAVVKTSSAPVLVRSAFELPEAQRAAIGQTLNETFSADVQVGFEVAPDLISGIELATDGHRVGWTIANYLASLEKDVGELLDAADAPEPSHEARSEPHAD